MIKHNKLILLIICGLFQAYGQSEKEKVVLVFDKAIMSLKNDRFVIDGQTFKYFSAKKKKSRASYDNIKDDIATLDDINLEIKTSGNYDKKRNEEFYYSDFFDIYVYVADSNNSGFLSC